MLSPGTAITLAVSNKNGRLRYERNSIESRFTLDWRYSGHLNRWHRRNNQTLSRLRSGIKNLASVLPKCKDLPSRSITWPHADTVIWLDYPLYIIYWRLFWRTLKRTLGKMELWNGNRERLRVQFFSRDSLFVWAKDSHYRRHKMYETIIAENYFPNLTFLRFRHPRETANWLKQLQD